MAEITDLPSRCISASIGMLIMSSEGLHNIEIMNSRVNTLVFSRLMKSITSKEATIVSTQSVIEATPAMRDEFLLKLTCFIYSLYFLSILPFEKRHSVNQLDLSLFPSQILHSVQNFLCHWELFSSVTFDSLSRLQGHEIVCPRII